MSPRKSRNAATNGGRTPTKRPDEQSTSRPTEVKTECIHEVDGTEKEITNAAAVATQLLRDPSLFTVNATNTNTLVGHLPGIGGGGRRIGRKRKLAPEERILLAQLYHDHFTIYHSKRYLGPDYIDGVANLKQWLISDWSSRLSALGVSERTPIDIGNRINEMIMEVSDFRTQSNVLHNMRLSPAFLLFNKVYDYIHFTHDKVEELLDRYEKKICNDIEREIVAEVAAQKHAPWSTEEKSLLAQLYNANARIYNVMPIRSKDADARAALLGSWSSQISAVGVCERSPEEVQAKIAFYRAQVASSSEAGQSPRKRGRSGCKRPRRDESPTTAAIAEASGVVDCEKDDYTMHDLFNEVKQIQDELVHVDMKSENYDSVAACAGGSGSLDEPYFSLSDPSSSFVPSTVVYPPSIGRTNRPHMSRAEKHLLGLLYRQQHKNYEQFNNPHIARKTPTNKKWKLLKDWSEKLSSLGVSQRVPEELATKISQYKNLVKSHKKCMEGGLDSIYFSSEYKMRRCLRPLSPTTRLYDTTDKTVADSTCSAEAINAFIEEAQQSLSYPSSGGQLNQLAGLDTTSSPNDSEGVRPVSSSGNNVIELTDSDLATISSDHSGEPNDVKFDSQRVAADSDTPADPNAPLTLAAILPDQPVDEVDIYGQVFNKIFDDMRSCEETGATVMVYDSVDNSGHVTRMAVTRFVSDRDTNFFIWTRYLDIEVDVPLTMFVCYMCEQMAQSVAVPSTAFNRRGQLMGYMPNSALLAQQSLPSMVLSADCRPVNLSWVRGCPRHRCVPFLLSTMCEKMAEISHMLVRVTPHELP